MKKIIVITLCLLFAISSTAQTRESLTGYNYGDGNYHYYYFSYEGFNFSFIIDLGAHYSDLLNYYHKLNHGEHNFRNFIKKDPFPSPVQQVSSFLFGTAYANNINLADLTLAFVQSIPHFEYMGTYQQYATEVLVNGTGDCSDKSVLLAALLTRNDYDTVFIDFPEHLAVGLYSERNGCSWTHRNRRFVICEPNSNYPIGVTDNCGSAIIHD